MARIRGLLMIPEHHRIRGEHRSVRRQSNSRGKRPHNATTASPPGRAIVRSSEISGTYVRPSGAPPWKSASLIRPACHHGFIRAVSRATATKKKKERKKSCLFEWMAATGYRKRNQNASRRHAPTYGHSAIIRRKEVYSTGFLPRSRSLLQPASLLEAAHHHLLLDSRYT